jgi:nucleotidyltransferase/DNA polymerase involved in DNA repair
LQFEDLADCLAWWGVRGEDPRAVVPHRPVQSISAEQTFEQDLSRLVRADIVSREEALLHADSPSNLMWRLQNDDTSLPAGVVAEPSPDDDEITFTEVTLDVIVEKPARALLFPSLSTGP